MLRKLLNACRYLYLFPFMCLVGWSVVFLRSKMAEAQPLLVLIIGADSLVALFALGLGLRIGIKLRRQLDRQCDQANQDRSVLHSRVQTLDRNLSALVQELNELENMVTSLQNGLPEAGSTDVRVGGEPRYVTTRRGGGDPQSGPDEASVLPVRHGTGLAPDSMLEGELMDLVKAYDYCRGGERFVSATAIAGRLVKVGVVVSEPEAMRLIHHLVQTYPDAVRLETIRGREGGQLAIFKEAIRSGSQ